MNTKDFIRLGVPLGEATRRATDFVAKFVLGGGDKSRLEAEMKAIVAQPASFLNDALRGEFAKALLNAPPPPRTEPVKYRQWGEGLEQEAVMENHHNFAWKERHVIDGVEREVVVHRKCATPAGAGVLGIIPGSMASPGFVVRGKGNAESLNSASHGAGRVMSRECRGRTTTSSGVKSHCEV